MTGTTTWSELVSQPDAWQSLLDRLGSSSGFEPLSLEDFDEVMLVGSGTSYYLATAAADWIRRRHDIPTRAVPSCEVMLDPLHTRVKPDGKYLAIGFSRSGESSELVLAIKALKLVGYSVLSVGCTEDSSLMRLGDWQWLVREGYEDGLVMLRSFTCMLLAIQVMFGTEQDRQALRAVPAAGRDLLDAQRAAIEALANKRPFHRFVFLASGSDYPLAIEASLKIQEMSISTSEAYPSLEYRHGPKATADRNTLVTLFALSDQGHGLALARDVKALGAALLVVGPGAEAYAGIADLAVPSSGDLTAAQASVLSLLPIQMMAFGTAMRKGQNPDAPVNLSKVVIF